MFLRGRYNFYTCFKVGEDVERFSKGDEVIGLLSVDQYFDVKNENTIILLEYMLGE